MNQIKKIKIHNKLLLFISLVLFFLAGYYIIDEISKKNHELIKLNISINSVELYLCLLLLIILQFFNWFLEAVKFRILYLPYESISLKKAIYSVYIGNFTSFFTPDRMGSFIGRFLYLKNSSKLMITAVTAIGNLAQLIITILFMLIGSALYIMIDNQLVEFSNEIIISIFMAYFILFISLVIIYLNPSIVLQFMTRWKTMKTYILRLQSLDKLSTKTKTYVLLLSMLRYMIFYLQFYIVTIGFDLNISAVELLVFIGLLYGIITFIPSPFMGNLGTREALSIYLASGVIGLYAPLISFIIWLVNVALSTLIGGALYSVLIKKEAT